MPSIEVGFPEGKKVSASMKGFTIDTDQPVAEGGGGEEPSPFDLFLSSIATCTGFYALRFCESKNINMQGMKLILDTEKNPETGMIGKMQLKLTLPEDFPEKYKKAIVRSMNLCSVKKHMMDPPEFNIIAE
ncbi:OsmC family protein [Isachenkonia alkalipeptolytica]|uniref:Osmotically inducible protein OsmC n=1 Tax=Isachenkonia alkalipeptolytica TaxID=2565777 RepID=A0AA43XIM5_9CLOT|nr:OsmC family protein [Isachenkonia alkalipeptolytica]NBG86976.1 osmotically inducible protein OsmC [Isachenkonia alkalipeptolytica]